MNKHSLLFLFLFFNHLVNAQYLSTNKGSIVIKGTAMNSKSMASIETNHCVYYLKNKSNWSKKEIGKKVKIKGTLILKQYITKEGENLPQVISELYLIEHSRIKVISFWKTNLYRKLIPKEHRKDPFD